MVLLLSSLLLFAFYSHHAWSTSSSENRTLQARSPQSHLKLVVVARKTTPISRRIQKGVQECGVWIGKDSYRPGIYLEADPHTRRWERHDEAPHPVAGHEVSRALPSKNLVSALVMYHKLKLPAASAPEDESEPGWCMKNSYDLLGFWQSEGLLDGKLEKPSQEEAKEMTEKGSGTTEPETWRRRIVAYNQLGARSLHRRNLEEGGFPLTYIAGPPADGPGALNCGVFIHRAGITGTYLKLTPEGAVRHDHALQPPGGHSTGRKLIQSRVVLAIRDAHANWHGHVHDAASCNAITARLLDRWQKERWLMSSRRPPSPTERERLAEKRKEKEMAEKNKPPPSFWDSAQSYVRTQYGHAKTHFGQAVSARPGDNETPRAPALAHTKTLPSGAEPRSLRTGPESETADRPALKAHSLRRRSTWPPPELLRQWPAAPRRDDAEEPREPRAPRAPRGLPPHLRLSAGEAPRAPQHEPGRSHAAPAAGGGLRDGTVLPRKETQQLTEYPVYVVGASPLLGEPCGVWIHTAMTTDAKTRERREVGQRLVADRELERWRRVPRPAKPHAMWRVHVMRKGAVAKAAAAAVETELEGPRGGEAEHEWCEREAGKLVERWVGKGLMADRRVPEGLANSRGEEASRSRKAEAESGSESPNPRSPSNRLSLG